MTERSVFHETAERCCTVFLGWRLREDRDALLALGEGRLEIDMLREEAWCDEEPLPPLFIAGALREALGRALLDSEIAIEKLEAARLEAEFARREVRRHGKTKDALQATVRVVLRVAGQEYAHEMHNR